MSGCEHVSCGSKEKIWLPYVFRGRERGLKPHRYCVKCGLVKRSSADKPRDIGYYMNVLGMLYSEQRIAKVQIRLIAQALERAGIDDSYGLDRYQQERLFIDVVVRQTGIPEENIRKYL
jgi:hypothetical protein